MVVLLAKIYYFIFHDNTTRKLKKKKNQAWVVKMKVIVRHLQGIMRSSFFYNIEWISFFFFFLIGKYKTSIQIRKKLQPQYTGTEQRVIKIKAEYKSLKFPEN